MELLKLMFGQGGKVAIPKPVAAYKTDWHTNEVRGEK